MPQYTLQDILFPRPDYSSLHQETIIAAQPLPQIDNLPLEVFVSGFPIELSGWNGNFIRQEGSCEFKKKAYRLYGVIPILATTIYFRDGCWNFMRDCDGFPICKNDLLEAQWSKGLFIVSRVPLTAHFSHKMYITVVCLCVLALLLVMRSK